MSGMARGAVSLHGKHPFQRCRRNAQPSGNRNIIFYILVHSAAADDCTGRDDNYRSTFGCQLQRKLCRHLQRDCIFSEHTQCAVYVCL